ncbi:MAG: hypothetical protein ACR2PX_13195 [Endozoicomonas sp.]|uniref:hypothetical protein n=1 Tax=Endozoicomonas sp. TaxID=1892382 RepID=UPI003D9AC8A0
MISPHELGAGLSLGASDLLEPDWAEHGNVFAGTGEDDFSTDFEYSMKLKNRSKNFIMIQKVEDF